MRKKTKCLGGGALAVIGIDLFFILGALTTAGIGEKMEASILAGIFVPLVCWLFCGVKYLLSNNPASRRNSEIDGAFWKILLRISWMLATLPLVFMIVGIPFNSQPLGWLACATLGLIYSMVLKSSSSQYRRLF